MVTQGAQNLNPETICAALSGLQIGGSDLFVDSEFQGGECRIFKISFKDHPSVSTRVNHPFHGSQQDAVDNVDMETRIFRTLEAKCFPWSPRYRAASLTFDNPINYPFVVLDWTEGFPLKWDDSFPSQPIREALLARLAKIQLSLMCGCYFYLGTVTATNFFERRIRNQLRRVNDGKLPGITEKDCLDQLALLPRLLGQERDSRLFAVDHGDLKPANIIIDQENNIKCIIDWGFAATVPIVQAARLPCFLWTDDSVTRAPSQAMLKDRQSYIDSFPEETLTALFMKRWQGAKDVDYRTLYLESISSRGMLPSMASVEWKLSYCDLIEENLEN